MIVRPAPGATQPMMGRMRGGKVWKKVGEVPALATPLLAGLRERNSRLCCDFHSLLPSVRQFEVCRIRLTLVNHVKFVHHRNQKPS